MDNFKKTVINKELRLEICKYIIYIILGVGVFYYFLMDLLRVFLGSPGFNKFGILIPILVMLAVILLWVYWCFKIKRINAYKNTVITYAIKGEVRSANIINIEANLFRTKIYYELPPLKHMLKLHFKNNTNPKEVLYFILDGSIYYLDVK